MNNNIKKLNLCKNLEVKITIIIILSHLSVL